jgi:hypothetical protein
MLEIGLTPHRYGWPSWPEAFVRATTGIRFLAPAVTLGFLACATDPTPPSPATLDITTVTEGSPGTDSYAIRVDDGAPRPVGPNGSLRIPDLAAGEHRLELDGLVHPCAAAGEHPRTITLTAGETLAVELRVVCTPQGSVAIVTRTAGESRDPDGYLVRIDAGPPQRVASDGSARVEELAPQAYTVTIDDVAPNCDVGGGTTRDVTVVDRSEAEVVFDVACTFIGAVRWDSILLPPGFESRFSGNKTLWGSSPSNLFLIGGDDQLPSTGAAILHYDGREWAEQARFPDTRLLAITGISATDIYVMGNAGTPSRGLILHYDGSRWSEIAGFEGEPDGVQYADLWRSPSGELLLAGTVDGNRVAARRDGATWSQVEMPGSTLRQPGAGKGGGTSLTDLWAIDWTWNCDDCTSVSSFIGHWDGAQWSPPYEEQYSFFVDILALAPDDVWVVGADYGSNGFARVVHWDGAAWTPGQPVPEDYYVNPLVDIWGSSSADIYAAGDGVLLRYDGTRWRVVPGLGGRMIWGLSRDDVYLLYRDANAGRDVLVHGRP